jgi:hypothetical protein
MEAAFFTSYGAASNFHDALRSAITEGVRWDAANPGAQDEHNGLPIDLGVAEEVGQVAANIALAGREQAANAYQQQHSVELQRQQDEIMEALYKALATAKVIVDRHPGDKVRGMLEVSASIGQAIAMPGASPVMMVIILAALVVEVCSSDAYDALLATRTSLDGFRL